MVSMRTAESSEHSDSPLGIGRETGAGRVKFPTYRVTALIFSYFCFITFSDRH